MVVDQSEFESFGFWFSSYMVDFAMLALFMLVGWAILAFALAAIRNSPARAAKMIAGTIKRAFIVDFPRTSGRRTMAMSRLAIQEAIRNKVLIIFALFVASCKACNYIFLCFLHVIFHFLPSPNSQPVKSLNILVFSLLFCEKRPFQIDGN